MLKQNKMPPLNEETKLFFCKKCKSTTEHYYKLNLALDFSRMISSLCSGIIICCIFVFFLGTGIENNWPGWTLYPILILTFAGFYPLRAFFFKKFMSVYYSNRRYWSCSQCKKDHKELGAEKKVDVQKSIPLNKITDELYPRNSNENNNQHIIPCPVSYFNACDYFSMHDMHDLDMNETICSLKKRRLIHDQHGGKITGDKEFCLGCKEYKVSMSKLGIIINNSPVNEASIEFLRKLYPDHKSPDFSKIFDDWLNDKQHLT